VHKSFWLGLIGGIFGILAGLLVGFIGAMGDALGIGDYGLYTWAVLVFLLSILGIVGGALERWKLIGGVIMIIAGIGIVVVIGMLGFLTLVLFIIGGALLLVDASKESKAQPAQYAYAQPIAAATGDQANATVMPQKGNFCPNCGATRKVDGQSFCEYCGTAFH